MVVYFERLYKQKGMRRSEHFKKPRILECKSFTFPINSNLNWWSVSDDEKYLTQDYSYLQNVDRATVRSYFDYNLKEEEVAGNFTNKSFLSSVYLKEADDKIKDFKFLKPGQDLKIPEKMLFINNYGAVNSKVKYPTQPLERQYKFLNTYNTVINNIFLEHKDRTKFLILEMPTYLPTRMELDKYASNLTKAFLDKLPTYQHLLFLDLWKFLTPELKQESVLNKIPKLNYKEIILLLVLDNKMMMIGLDYLVSMVHEYSYEIKGMQARKAEVFRKMFYNTIITFITSPSMTDIELEKNEAEIEAEALNENKAGSDNNPDDDAQDSSIVAKKIDPELGGNAFHDNSNRFNNTLSILKNQLQSREMKYLAKQDEKEDVITDEDDADDELVEDESNDIQDAETFSKDVDEYEEDNINVYDTSPPEGSEDDETGTLLERELLKNVTDDFKKYNSAEDILKEEYHYDRFKQDLEAMKQNKRLTSANYNKMLETYEERLNSKEPYNLYGSLKDTLDDNKDNYNLPDINITDNKVIFDKSMNKNVINNVRKKYVDTQYKKDIVRVFNSLQNSSFVIESHNVERKINAVNDIEEHKLSVRSIDNKVHNFSVLLPVIQEDGTMKLSNNNYMLRLQRQTQVLVKLSPTEVKLTSNYGRSFVSKATYKKDDLGYKILMFVMKLHNQGVVTNLLALPSENPEGKYPRMYAHFARYIKSFMFNGFKFHFEYESRVNLVKDSNELAKIEAGHFVVVGTFKHYLVLMDYEDRLWIKKDNSVDEIPSLLEIIGLEPKDLPVEFALIRILKKQVPLALVLSYYMGFMNLLKTLKVEYDILPVNKRVMAGNDYYVIKFRDCKVRLYRDNGRNDIIVAGLIYIQNQLLECNLDVLNDKSKINVLLSRLGYKISEINELKTMETMFMDPITISIAKQLNMPTSFKGLLIKASEMLVTDDYDNPQDMKAMTIRGYERIAGMLYRELSVAVRTYNNANTYSRAKLNFNPVTILQKIGEDSTTVLVDDLNPIAAIKMTEDVSFLGEGGFSKETMSRDTRALNVSEIGIISEAAKDNGDVGTTAYLTAAPNITDVRGNSREVNIEQDGLGSLFSTTALLNPFSLTDDTKRLNFINIQSAHQIPMKNMTPFYVRTGYDAILPIRAPEKFCVSAIEDGVVDHVSKNEVVVTYKTKGKYNYSLKPWTSKEESHLCYTHYMLPNVKTGDKFIKDDTLVYDSSFFEPDIFNPKRVIYKQGNMLTIALLEDPETYEDSAGIVRSTDSLLATTVTKINSRVLDKTDSVEGLVKIGDHVDSDTVLYSVIDANTSAFSMSKDTLALLKNLKRLSPSAKVKGTISKIEVKYNCKFEELSDSLKEIVKVTDADLKQRTGFTGDITEGGYTIEGVPLIPNQLELKIYINVDEGMGVGDKMVIGNQLKCTVGEVFNYDLTAEDGQKIDATFSSRSIYARIVVSPMLLGTTGMVIEKLQEKVVSDYFS